MDMQWDDKLVMQKLLKMETVTAKKAVRKGVRAGRKDTLAMARYKAANLENAGTGMAELISESLYLRVTPKSVLHAKDAYAMQIEFKTDGQFDRLIDISKEGVRNFIPHAIEYGHVGMYKGQARSKNRKSLVVSNVKKTIVAQPKPFMVPAHEETISRSFSSAKKVITSEIMKDWK